MQLVLFFQMSCNLLSELTAFETKGVDVEKSLNGIN